MKFNVFQLSRKGGRKNNEDRMGYCYTRDAALFVLADGMGGHAEGEVAAQLALQTMAAQFQQQAQPTIKKPADFLSDSLLAAHHRIVRYAGEKGLPDTPRTTLVAALVQKGHAIWVHCGDSRLYVVREGKILLRTRDHSYMEQGEFFAVKTENINRNVLFTCLGSPSRPVFDVSLPMRLHLLCLIDPYFYVLVCLNRSYHANQQTQAALGDEGTKRRQYRGVPAFFAQNKSRPKADQSIDKVLRPLPMVFYCVKKHRSCGVFSKFGE